MEALAAQNPASPALERLARPDTCVVATGQQVGLFLGPAYTIYKALTAARLARRLTEQGLPAVAVFWMATEDHDLAEVRRCNVYDAGFKPVSLVSPDRPSQSPVGPVRIGGDPAAELRGALDGLPLADEVLDAVAAAYPSGCTFGEGFRALLSHLLKRYDVLLLDPLAPAVRHLAAPVLTEAAGRHAELIALLLDRNRELAAAGYHSQVKVEKDSSLLFSLEGGRRMPLKSGAAPARSEDLSPNALLRPVVQDFIMPTVATVMGPAEVAYMAQAEVLYRALLGRMPVVVNRASFTLIDSRSAKLLERYGLSLHDLETGQEAVRAAIASKLIPAELRTNLESAAAATADRLKSLRAQLTAFDPSLADAAQRSASKILYQFGKIERKTGREALRRTDRAGEEAERLTRLLFPERHMQERYYSILPFLAEHGMSLVDRVYESVDAGSPDHHLLLL